MAVPHRNGYDAHVINRVAIFGDAGGGKSKLARELAAITASAGGHRHSAVPEGGEKVPDEEFLQAHAALIGRVEWIIGGYGGVRLAWDGRIPGLDAPGAREVGP